MVEKYNPVKIGQLISYQEFLVVHKLLQKNVLKIRYFWQTPHVQGNCAHYIFDI